MAERDVTARPVELQELPASIAGSRSLGTNNLDLIKGVKVNLSAMLGQCQISVEELFDLKEGSTLRLDAQVDDPVEVLLDGRVVARGELVVVGDSFGIRITEIG